MFRSAQIKITLLNVHSSILSRSILYRKKRKLVYFVEGVHLSIMFCCILNPEKNIDINNITLLIKCNSIFRVLHALLVLCKHLTHQALCKIHFDDQSASRIFYLPCLYLSEEEF